MDAKEIVRQVLLLDPARRLEVAEKILSSLDQPDPSIDALWLEEAERRLAAYRVGKVTPVPAEELFRKP